MDPRYQQLAARIGLGHSERIARLFAMLADETDADLLLAMPGDAAELAVKTGLAPEEAASRIQELFYRGLVFPSTKGGITKYRMSRDMVQFHDATLVWPAAPEAYLDLWREFMEEEWFSLAKTISQMTPKPFTRVIPVGVTLKPRTQILDFESVADIVSSASRLAVTPCTCRLSMRKCERTVEACLQVNRAADYTVARGSGREVTKEEALEILRKAEEDGLIHVTMNKSEVSNFICNCCPCCCQTMPVLIQGGVSVLDPSRFRAAIDPDLCTACGLCQERCYFGAITPQEGEDSPRQVNPEKCMGCGLCLTTCPAEAIGFPEVRPRDFVPGAA
ncbi:MAG: 4Fe-4S binding protein [Deltaproteobacteria bacterium]|nr:4Fe-4S binding protein [Deltaproteobacteria bacterium]